LIRLLVAFVGTRNLNRPTDLCKFKSSQKDKSRNAGRFHKCFHSKSNGFNCWRWEVYFFRADAGCLMRIAHLWN